MKLAQRIVTSTPLTELWNDSGILQARKVEDFGRAQIRGLLASGPVRFAVANVGTRLRWIQEEECFSFWRSEAGPHLAEPDARIEFNSFPNSYAYFASRWNEPGQCVIILLERAH